MKVINIYDKNSDIRCRGKNIFKTTEKFLSKFPKEYSECYYRNLNSLKLFEVDRMMHEEMNGQYDDGANVIMFSNRQSLGHEMFHMTQNDMINGVNAIESNIDIESGLIEGMTEYLNMQAYGLKEPESYSFEVFCVTMLKNIPNFFRPFLIPSHDDFINLFPNTKDAYSLLYSLNSYNEIEMDYLEAYYNEDDDIIIDIDKAQESIRDTIDNLINIELSFGKNKNELNIYGDKFLDYLGSNFIGDVLRQLYPDYFKYAEKRINRKVRKKR